MLQYALVVILLAYYYLFFYSYSSTVPKPDSVLLPHPVVRANFTGSNDRFSFVANGKTLWGDILPSPYIVHRDQIVRADSCQGVPDGEAVVARGRVLYDYLKDNPEIERSGPFVENNPYVQQRGHSFYFQCGSGRIQGLHMCASGETFVNGRCSTVQACTDKSDGTLLPDLENVRRYIECTDQQPILKQCPPSDFFLFDHCADTSDLTYYCQFYGNKSFLLDKKTRVDCRDGKPSYKRCREGERYFDLDRPCESTDCENVPDGTRLPLPEKRDGPFRFVTGFKRCLGGRVDKIERCSKTFDYDKTKGDDVLDFPMVFDGRRCSVPTFCENVFSDDPDIMVRVHEFTKHVKNWKVSPVYDSLAGYACEGGTRKRKNLPPGYVIKRYRVEKGCDGTLPKLPVPDAIERYYDCASDAVEVCPENQFFNGTKCMPMPRHAFKYKNLPIFQFDHLNFESWMSPWDYSKEASVKASCKGTEESTFLGLYNICIHPECRKYAFLSQTPDMTLLLPNGQGRCEMEGRRLKKRPRADFPYIFWEQRLLLEPSSDRETCTPGQSLKTGNFVWDSTVFATCDPEQPFVFCPSVHSGGIQKMQSGEWICNFPTSKTAILDSLNWTPFSTGELSKIQSIMWDPNDAEYVKKNKSSSAEIIPENGIDILKNERINLYVATPKPVLIHFRHRVNHPPHVSVEYFENEDAYQLHSSRSGYAFLVKIGNFTNKALNFPQYKAINYVDWFGSKVYRM